MLELIVNIRPLRSLRIRINIQYVEEGLISLDDSIYHWIEPHLNTDGAINIRQLLNHTCGIYNLREDNDLWNRIFAQPQAILNTEEMINEYTLEPYFEKGTDWAYSNTGYLILRIIIKKISGNSGAQEWGIFCTAEDMVNRYGLGLCGFEPALFNGLDIMGHGGNPIGYAAGCFYLPEHDLVIAVMDNTKDGESMWVINDILDVVIENI